MRSIAIFAQCFSSSGSTIWFTTWPSAVIQNHARDFGVVLPTGGAITWHKKKILLELCDAEISVWTGRPNRPRKPEPTGFGVTPHLGTSWFRFVRPMESWQSGGLTKTNQWRSWEPIGAGPSRLQRDQDASDNHIALAPSFNTLLEYASPRGPHAWTWWGAAFVQRTKPDIVEA